MSEILALYIHWPFCAAKCPYCDFNSHVRDHVDQALLALDPLWTAAGSPMHVFRTSAAALLRLTDGQVADVMDDTAA